MYTDKELIKKRFEASFGGYDRLAIVQQRICEQLARRVGELRRDGVSRAFEIGAGTGFLTSRLVAAYPGAEWYVNDLVPAAEKYLAKYLADIRSSYMWGDAEEIAFPDGTDLIASASTIQWFGDMPAFACKCSGALVSGGTLALSTFGKDNFKEIRATTGEGLDYLTMDELRELFGNSGFRVVLTEEYTETLYFGEPLDVLQHIKAIGVNSVRKKRWGPHRLAEFNESYRALFTSPGNGVGLTYHPILIVAEKI